MSWGGHVLFMIQMLRGNARNRPSLRRGYPRIHERGKETLLNVNYRKVRALSDEERAVLRKRIALEKKLRSRKSVLALLISAAILMGLVWVISYVADDLIEQYRLLRRQ
jgi:hypothetical protein